MVDQLPQTSNPRSADFRALLTSAGEALEAFPIISSVAGFITSLGLILGVYIATHWMFRKTGCAI